MVAYVVFILLSLVIGSAFAQTPLVPFTDCTSSAKISDSTYDPLARINISDVYAQFDYSEGRSLKLVLIGQTGKTIVPSESSSGSLTLSTLFSRTSVLTFTLNQTNSWFCSTVRPASPLPSLGSNTTYCPVSPGQLAFTVTTPLRHDYNLTTIVTRVRVVDPSSPGRELMCVDVQVTPVRDQHKTHNLGYPQILFWLSVGLVMAYWVVVGLARISAAWGRGVGRGRGWSTVRWAGTVFASAVSAERLTTHSALLRFATPSWRDVMFHTQWCASLAMLAVQWPRYAYPILGNAAWSTLLYNISLGNNKGTHWDPYAVNYTPPSTFQDQLADTTSPLFLNQNLPNGIFLLPQGARDGMPSFAASIGLRPQDLFPVSMKLWLTIVAAAVVVSTVIWSVDWFISSCTGRSRSGVARGSMSPPMRYSGGDANKESSALSALRSDEEPVFATTRGAPHKARRWWHYRLGQSSFHGSILQGNIVRLLVLFHFPITIFSTYEFSRSPKSDGSSKALAGLTFAVISVLIPLLLLVRLALTPTKKLYDATRTLLALGPLYSHYAQGSQMFAAVFLTHSLVVGIVLGAGQRSGTAQAIIILVVEVAYALATSIWLPWGELASMGIISFLFCVARIVTVVLLIILTPLVSVGNAPGGWIGYAIILVQGLVYLAFLLMLIVKVIEGFVRLISPVPFDKSTHSLDSGLLGALSQAGCFGARKPRRDKGREKSSGHSSGRHTPHSSLPSPGADKRAFPMYHNHQPSFLRPEQALLPYREDADDESGYIMGAWANSYPPQAQPAYQTVNTADASDSSLPGSGFARVGGGRANMDFPFAITAPDQAQSPRTRDNVAPSPPLPPGAMAASPGHMRSQSHVAVIENAYPGKVPSRHPLQGDTAGNSYDPLVPPHVIQTDGDSSGSSNARSKKLGFWQRNIFSRSRANEETMDEDDEPSPTTPKTAWFSRSKNQTDSDAEAQGSKPKGSSFLVVRNKKTSKPSPPKAPEPPAEEAAPTQSFVVVRPKRNTNPSASSS